MAAIFSESCWGADVGRWCPDGVEAPNAGLEGCDRPGVLLVEEDLSR